MDFMSVLLVFMLLVRSCVLLWATGIYSRTTHEGAIAFGVVSAFNGLGMILVSLGQNKIA